MDKQVLIIFKFKFLYKIIKELEKSLNFEIYEESDEKLLNERLNYFKNYLIISNKKLKDINNQFILNKFPIKLFTLIEKLNIEFLKFQFNEKSELIIGEYKIDLNSRELRQEDEVLKLTEKETNIIIYLSKTNKAVGINQLQSEVWGYQSKLETHTVETHIYRLRRKILETFNDDNFIISQKNGYQII